jgi:putative NIF3 family GTP cyclohydrolase 1 type 2
VVSGGGADAADVCRKEGVDALFTGEVGHSAYHLVREAGITVIAGGHYKTETPGVLAVMERVSSQFDVDCRFIDIPTGL